MSYIIDIPEPIIRKVIRLIEEGRYGTMQDFAMAAFQNQLQIEEMNQKYEPKEISFQKLESPRLSISSSTGYMSLKLSGLNPDRIQTVEATYDYPRSEWIFGQINRLLPVKFGLRFLLHKLQDGSRWFPLGVFHEQAAMEARKFGDRLQQQDEAYSRARSDRYSVGFPIGEESKSIPRYRSQFLGYLQPSTGSTFGALLNLYFAAISRDSKGQDLIGVTKEGKEFGLLRNPVIDDEADENTISVEETRYYIRHIQLKARHEADAVETLLYLIYNGKNDTQKIDYELSRKFPGWSRSQIATNRSGIIGRTQDLNLISKEYKGQNIEYSLTELGRESLKVLSNVR